MTIIESGLETVDAAAGCPCICSSGSSGADSFGASAGMCGFNCGCGGPSSSSDNWAANGNLASNSANVR